MAKTVGRGEVLGMNKNTSSSNSSKSKRITAAELDRRLGKTPTTNNSNSQLYATATNIKTGEKKYLVGGKLVDMKPQTTSQPRSRPVSNTVISKEGKITMTDLNKGLTVTTRTDVSGKQISRAVTAAGIPKERVRGTLSVPEKQSYIQRLQRSLTPTRTDSKKSRFAKSFAKEAVSFVTTPVIEAYNLGKIIGGDQTQRARLQNALNNIDIKQIGPSLGQMLQSTDPTTKGQVAFMFATLLVGPKVPLPKSKSISVIKNGVKSESKSIDAKISKLEGKKNLSRLDKKELSILKKEKKIIETELGLLDKTIRDATRKTYSQLEQSKKIQTTVSNVNKIKRIQTKKQRLKKQRVTLKPETISKKLGQFFGKSKKQQLVIMTKPKTTIELLEEAFNISGEVFKKLKNKIEKETGLKVVRRKGKFLLLKPKEQLRKGVKTSTKGKRSKEVLITGKKPLKPKTPSKQAADIKLDKALSENNITVLFKSKKAQAQFMTQVKGRGKTYKQKLKSIKQDYRDIKQAYNQVITDFRNKKIKQPPKQRKEQFIKKKNQLNKKLKTESNKIQKDLNKLKKVRGSGFILGLSTEQKKMMAIAQDLDKISLQLNKFEFPKRTGEGGQGNISSGGGKPIKRTPSTKTIKTTKPIFKLNKINKAPSGKTPLPLQFPIFFPNLPKSKTSRQGYDIILFKGKNRKIKKTLNLPNTRAINYARNFILKNKSKYDGYKLEKSTKTLIVDVSQKLFNDKFKKIPTKTILIEKKVSKIKKVKPKTTKKVKKVSKKLSKALIVPKYKKKSTTRRKSKKR